MKAKSKQRPSPALRNKKGVKRDMTIQSRVTAKEKALAIATFGKSLSRAIREFVCGQPVTQPSVLNNEDRREIMHALHALFVVTESIYASAEIGDTETVIQLRKTQIENFKHLIILCSSSFSN
jgi:hypothetical protein